MIDCADTNDGVTRACTLCGGTLTVRLFEKAAQEYWRCEGCTLVFALGRTNANFRESIDGYELAYRQYLDEGPLDVSNLDDMIAWIESYVDLGRSEIRLLDVGAGSGKLVKRLRKTRTCSVFAIEPSAALFKAYDLRSLGIEPITLPDLAARQSEFDVVTILDVLEHVPNAAEFVRAVARVTRPGGFVFITTPDVGGPLARLLGRHWHHYNAYHFALYGKRALAEAAERNSFEVVAAEHRSKRMSLDYVWRYAIDFLFTRHRQTTKYRPCRLAVPVNLRDTIAMVWQRR